MAECFVGGAGSGKVIQAGTFQDSTIVLDHIPVLLILTKKEWDAWNSNYTWKNAIVDVSLRVGAGTAVGSSGDTVPVTITVSGNTITVSGSFSTGSYVAIG